MIRAWGVNVEMDAVTADGNASLTLGGSRGEVSYPAAFGAGDGAFDRRPRPLIGCCTQHLFRKQS